MSRTANEPLTVSNDYVVKKLLLVLDRSSYTVQHDVPDFAADDGDFLLGLVENSSLSKPDRQRLLNLFAMINAKVDLLSKGQPAYRSQAEQPEDAL